MVWTIPVRCPLVRTVDDEISKPEDATRCGHGTPWLAEPARRVITATQEDPVTAAEPTTATRRQSWLGPGGLLNTQYHKAALMVYAFVVLAHWAEHVVQAVQIYVLGWPRPAAGGILGLFFPVLVTSEWLHYGYAVLMLVGFMTLRHGFTGRSRRWWNLALGIQVWHHFEHLLLLLQAMSGANLLGKPVPTSIAQLIMPRVELHLLYNALVTVPMVVAMIYHLRPRSAERAEMNCSCAHPAAVPG
jgi:hypothetical protein